MGLSTPAAAWLTLAVQLGFVAGTLVSALGNLPDVFCDAAAVRRLRVPRRGRQRRRRPSPRAAPVAAWCCALLTGFFLAGVYPPGMKIMATWFRRGRGVALGVLVGGISLGKAFPYLVNAVGSGLARQRSRRLGVRGRRRRVVLLFVGDGPYAAPAARFDAGQIAKVFGNRGVRLADFGYFGHMWELYAMWTWFPVFLRASFARPRAARPSLAEGASFLVIGAGRSGASLAGLARRPHRPDRRDLVGHGDFRRLLPVIGLLFDAKPRRPPRGRRRLGRRRSSPTRRSSRRASRSWRTRRYIGTALTVQTCVGFLLTMVSIELVPRPSRPSAGAGPSPCSPPGPFSAIVAMQRLRRLPEAAQIAQGRR